MQTKVNTYHDRQTRTENIAETGVLSPGEAYTVAHGIFGADGTPRAADLKGKEDE